MRPMLAAGALALTLTLPQAAWCCGGQGGSSIAITYGGGKYIVSNVGRRWLDVVFTAWNTSYAMRLAPGQSDSPRSPGMLGQFMQGYRSCVATVVPAR
ncbi:MAG: hypothetical protein ACREHF_03385 [Rhizomicrobium sp.]